MKLCRSNGSFRSSDGAALADLGGDEFLRQLKLADELRVAEGFFDGIEVFALEVFDERHLEDGAIVGFADEDGDFSEPGELGRAPAPLTGYQFKVLPLRPDHERLNDPLLADGIGELAKRLGGKILARLERAGADLSQGHVADLIPHRRRGRDGRRETGLRGRRRHDGDDSGWRQGNRRWIGDDRSATQQRAQAPSQSRL